MADILVHDLSPELKAWLGEYAQAGGLTVSQAAAEILQRAMDAEASDENVSAGVGASDYLSETLKEVFHTKDEAEEFIRSHEEVAGDSRKV